jgi:hypothetical protein
MLGLDQRNRFFIPMVPPYVSQELLKEMLQHTNWIGFNRFEVRHSKFYDEAKKRGLRDTFKIDDGTSIFLTSTAKDEELIRFYGQNSCFEELKSDIINFDVNMAMGPHWFVYKKDPPERRKKDIKKAFELNMSFSDLENVLPTIHGTKFQEIRRFVEPFKAQGKKLFVLPGREYLINLEDREKAQREFSFLTSTTARAEKIDLIVTGCNSPKLQESLPAVLGFAGLGWLIQSKQRRLIMGKKYVSIFDPRFFCNDSDCCALIHKKDLTKPENDSVRAIHNLRQINACLEERPKFSQTYLGDFNGHIL